MINKEVSSNYDRKIAGSYLKGWNLAVIFYEEYLKMGQKK
ncbi:hypothetical protein BH23BAC1_BH23BAC1_10740 [soil metagenome]